MWNKTYLGHGIGLRTAHYTYLLEHPVKGVDWFEIISENFFGPGGRPWAVLRKVREQVPIVMHGVSLGIGNTSPLDWDYLKQLKDLAEKVEPAWVSDHICWGGYGGHYSHDLLPLPYTQETLDHLVPRIHEVQEFLGRPMMFENASSYVSFAESEMSEWEFVAELAKRTGSGILLDVNNVYVSANNHNFEVDDYINAIPKEYVGQFHVAGHTDKGNYLLDTHIGPVIPEVWDVYKKALARFGPISTLVEWDEDVPSFEEVVAESQRARHIEQEFLHDTPTQSRSHSEVVLEEHLRTTR
ncbi:MAG: hypothetical protein CL920_29445 [Deltaproteobacteria bacterium]|nr:hypothetical protein [Deltaproteobacteria bacterium]MBU52837.1 hypothetical protein [Deltaproteobacteria bacterium]|tara:strand:- start:8544 stop:9437 length:894 start_codon:yes stop_codon:yes gene_type:complete